MEVYTRIYANDNGLVELNLFYDEDAVWDWDHDMLNILFGKTSFSVCIPYEDIHRPLSYQDEITLVIRYGCYYYTNEPRKSDVYSVHRKENKTFISYKDAIDALVHNKYKCCPAHCFLECFRPRGITNKSFDVCFGS